MVHQAEHAVLPGLGRAHENYLAGGLVDDEAARLGVFHPVGNLGFPATGCDHTWKADDCDHH